MLHMYVFVGMRSAINSHIQKYITRWIAAKDRLQ
ncbi:mCG147591 [Mus musculus]|nr:mCG147591 [Mus musculus]